MKVVSVNTGTKREVSWQGKKVFTGIFKSPVESIFLGKEDVANDDVVDRRFHGGVDKAVYAYNADHYPYWIQLFPNIKHDYGMLGENLTIEGLHENEIKIGNVYQIGEAKVQVSQPRQPCFKLGIRFNDQSVLKEMVQSGFSGIYFRVIQEGNVKVGDELVLIESFDNEPFVVDCHEVNFNKTTKDLKRQMVLNSRFLSKSYLN